MAAPVRPGNPGGRDRLRRPQPAGGGVSRQGLGDGPTPGKPAPGALARHAGLGGPRPAVVLEPTCGEGSFLVAAASVFKNARLLGYELKDSYANAARTKLPAARTRISVADFF